MRRFRNKHAHTTRRVGSFTYQQNHGKPGVVYILSNPLLRDGLVKIGQSTRSGSARAAELKKEAKTGMPAGYVCLFEQSTSDCGRAELLVHQRLEEQRRGKRGQEFFEVDIETAKKVIIDVCIEISGSTQNPETFKSQATTSATPLHRITTQFENTHLIARDSSRGSPQKLNLQIPDWLRKPPLGWARLLFWLLVINLVARSLYRHF